MIPDSAQRRREFYHIEAKSPEGIAGHEQHFKPTEVQIRFKILDQNEYS